VSRAKDLPNKAEALLAEATSSLPQGGEDRPGQITMTRSVASAIESGRHLIVQAGTGTGKSLAYLAPIIASGKKTLVATATKALQDQLATKELPHLESVANVPFDFAVLKGRNNYACRQRINEADNREQLTLQGVAGSVAEEVDLLIEWADASQTGDRAELDFEPSAAAWSSVSVSSQECPGRNRCPAGSICFAEAARDAAAAADVLVVNTHLLGLDIFTDGQILPDFDVVVVDEAHQLEDVITSTCGFSISGVRFSTLARTVGAILEDPESIERLHDAADVVSAALEPLVGRRINPSEEADLNAALTIARSNVDRVLAVLKDLPEDHEDTDANARRVRALQATSSMQAELHLSSDIGVEQVAWVETNMSAPTLRVAPLDVGEILEPKLWERSVAILTSATIPSALPDALGMAELDHDHLDVGSPFDYETQSLLYCAAHLPEPRSPVYDEEMLPHLEQLILAAGGRTLALFTSWRKMEIAADHLIPRMPWPVMTQRDLPKPALIEKFQAEADSTLLATLGFWQGIDVPGDALWLVTIDRLPFPRPNDPLLEARREHAGRYAFRTVDLPRATTLLAQGAGRLIRTTTDRGVVAVLDSRLASKKSYRWEFIQRLPPMERTSDPEVALSYLRNLRDG